MLTWYWKVDAPDRNTQLPAVEVAVKMEFVPLPDTIRSPIIPP